MTTAPVPTTVDEPPTAPVPILEGSFALFAPPNGGLVLAWRKKGTSEDRHLPVPALVLQMAAQASKATPEDVISKLASGEF